MKNRRFASNAILMFVLLASLFASPDRQLALAAPSEFFLSEYIEGSSYNKALEIYNGTGAAINLATGGYQVELYQNGASTPNYVITLSGSVSNNDVYVLAHTSADAVILAQADQTSGSLQHNGDDAVVLKKGSTVIDVIGQVGFDPGTEWGSGLTSTADNTLRRKSSICQGDTNPSDTFDPALEWDGYAQDTFGGLGSHSANCSGLTDPLINEFVFNHAGDDDHEYVEITGDASADYSGFSLLQVEGDSANNPGAVLSTATLGSTDSNGYWTTGFLSNIYQNGTTSLLLVEGFSGSVGSDLDTNNDGSLDVNPWTRLIDDVAVSDGDTGDRVYATTSLTASFDGGALTPGGASRIPNKTDTNTIGDWKRNDFDLAGIPGYTGTPQIPEALNTPGAANQEVTAVPPVVINELDADTPATDVLEFIELYDGGTGSTSLSGLVVVLYNGAVDTSFAAYDLDGYSTDASGYFLLGNEDLAGVDLVIANGILQNGADAAALYQANGSNFPNGTAVTTANLVDAIVYGTNDPEDAGLMPLLNSGQPQVNEDSNGAGATESSQRCPNGAGGQRNTSGYIQTLPTPGAANTCPVITPCGDPATLIHAIQGGTNTSPLAGTSQTIEGLVTGDFQGASQLRGFFVQEENAQADTDPSTSEGIFVLSSLPVNLGDVVRVAGVVAENYGLTQLGSVGYATVCSSGYTLPAAENLSLPFPAPSGGVHYLERYEGMYLTLPTGLFVTEVYNLGRGGEFMLSANARLWQPTNVALPGALALAVQAENDRNRIVVDDGSIYTENPATVIHPAPALSLSNRVRVGDTTANTITGVLSWSDSGWYNSDYAYRLHPAEGASFTSQNPRPAALPSVGGNLKVASINTLNFFNGNGDGTGFPTSRGADTYDEFLKQRDKLVQALLAVDADIIGLMELENDGYGALSAIQDLVDSLNSALGSTVYDFIDPGVAKIGTDAIAVGIIYKPGRVTPYHGAEILDSTDDPTYISDKNRPALAQTFEENTWQERFTVVVNHLKSKGSDCDSIGDPDMGDGQGNCNLTRTTAAQAEVNWLATDPTDSDDPDFLIIGDMNAYALEDPITAFKDGGYTDLVGAYGNQYSYIFKGQSGYLDHALGSPSLLDQVSGVTDFHINADEPSAFDYNDYNQPVLYQDDMYRFADHDPTVVGLEILPPNTYADPGHVCAGNAPCFTTIQAAIDNVRRSGQVYVYTGSYPENVDLNRSTTVNVLGNITIQGFSQSAGVFNAPIGTLALTGSFTLSGGTFNHRNGVVIFNGSASQTISGAATFYGLTLDNSGAGLSLAGSTRIESLLTLADGLFVLDGYHLTLGPSASLSGGSLDSMVITNGAGELRKEFSAPGEFTFPVGDMQETPEYSPATLNFTTIGGPGYAAVRVVNLRQPKNGAAPYIKRYWSLTQSGLDSFSCTGTFSYTEADLLLGEALESDLRALKYSYATSSWTVYGPVDPINNTFSLTTDSFSDVTAGPASPSAVTLADLAATPEAGQVTISWLAMLEQDVYGYNIYRAESLDGLRILLNPEPIEPRSLGLPTPYTFEDATVQPGTTYFYWIEAWGPFGSHWSPALVAVTKWLLGLGVVLR
ncbi:MAG: ExeM/NucH family extracellular endonuclease [Anaerolineales bacterium]|nr:ExeM/NucH family extracellular endonuclease [Anaerolineales bacterium]